MKTATTLWLFPLVMFVGCTVVGPDYSRPEAPVPDEFRGTDGASPQEAPDTQTVGDLSWLEVFDDPVLQELVQCALTENYDVRIAAERVLQARGFVRITRADHYPDVRVGGDYQYLRTTNNGAIPFPPGEDEEQQQWSVFGDLSWELDFWGRFERASEAARAELLQTQYSRRVVIQTLVTDLALAYFDLLLQDEQLAITRRTLASRKKSFELVGFRLEQGVTNKVEYRQSESLVQRTESSGTLKVRRDAA